MPALDDKINKSGQIEARGAVAVLTKEILGEHRE